MRFFGDNADYKSAIARQCQWCEVGPPEWSPYAKLWIHRLPKLDRRCANPPNNYGLTTQVPEETISSAAHQAYLRDRKVKP